MKTLLLVLALSSSAAMASSLEKFEGKFEASCNFYPEVRYVVEVKFDKEKNSVEIAETEETSGDRYPFNSLYEAINEGKIVSKVETEIYGCEKRTYESTFSGNLLKSKYTEKTCLLSYVTHSVVEELLLKNNGDLVSTTRLKTGTSVCELKRIK